MKKNGDANNNPAFMFIVAAVFISGGILVWISKLVSNQNGSIVLMRVLGSIFLVVGVIILCWAIYRTILIVKYNKLLKDTTVYITEATYMGSKLAGGTITQVGGHPMSEGGTIASLGDVPLKASVYKKIKYTYRDEKGVTHNVISINSFTPNQVSFLEQKQTFKIKCKGNMSAIIEELPEMNPMYNV